MELPADSAGSFFASGASVVILRETLQFVRS